MSMVFSKRMPKNHLERLHIKCVREQLIGRRADSPRCVTRSNFDTPRDRIRIDLRVGGRYELTMVRRDGSGEFGISYEIVELVEPELIVLRSDPMPDMGMHEP